VSAQFNLFRSEGQQLISSNEGLGIREVTSRTSQVQSGVDSIFII
ncbi:MAG: hypothetical protein ACI9FN_003459, partial [Saprospiraceae bacterium]